MTLKTVSEVLRRMPVSTHKREDMLIMYCDKIFFHTLSFILFLDFGCFYLDAYVRFRNNMSMRFHTTIFIRLFAFSIVKNMRFALS